MMYVRVFVGDKFSKNSNPRLLNILTIICHGTVLLLEASQQPSPGPERPYFHTRTDKRMQLHRVCTIELTY